MAILKFCSQLINNNLPPFLETFTSNFFAVHHHYNFRNPSRLSPKIKHKFPKQSLRYKLIAILYEPCYDLLEMAKTQSQRNFMNFVRNDILTGYSSTCKLLVCHICKRI